MKISIPSWLAVAIVVALFSLHGTRASAITCGSSCSSDADCLSNPLNYCSYCSDSGTCQPMCGVGCRRDSDCGTGGPNTCTFCHNAMCINPMPRSPSSISSLFFSQRLNVDEMYRCGDFCGYGVDAACHFNGTGACAGVEQQCCSCHPTDLTKGCGNWTVNNCGQSCIVSSDCSGVAGDCGVCSGGLCRQSNCAAKCSSSSDCTALPGSCTVCTTNHVCVEPVGPQCGDLCTSSAECQDNKDCSQCVGWYCSAPQKCGQNCISSGQCMGYNPGTTCTACIGATCQQTRPCGGSCGGDDWCGKSCPVCYFASCKSRAEVDRLLGLVNKTLSDLKDLSQGEK
jgi:hypothetical protein